MAALKWLPCFMVEKRCLFRDGRCNCYHSQAGDGKCLLLPHTKSQPKSQVNDLPGGNDIVAIG